MSTWPLVKASAPRSSTRKGKLRPCPTKDGSCMLIGFLVTLVLRSVDLDHPPLDLGHRRTVHVDHGGLRLELAPSVDRCFSTALRHELAPFDVDLARGLDGDVLTCQLEVAGVGDRDGGVA